jgi:hypothetical protein
MDVFFLSTHSIEKGNADHEYPTGTELDNRLHRDVRHGGVRRKSRVRNFTRARGDEFRPSFANPYDSGDKHTGRCRSFCVIHCIAGGGTVEPGGSLDRHGFCGGCAMDSKSGRIRIKRNYQVSE